MGTQQILLIVLSVIIVGAAIAVGITMFNSQAYSANKSSLAADAQSFATQVVQYYKTPKSQGGAGKDATTEGNLWTPDLIGKYIGWDNASTRTESGNFTITTADQTKVIITGKGTETKGAAKLKPKIETTLTLDSGKISAVASDSAS